jgi:hypothetical protein
MNPPGDLAMAVRERAADRCQYCMMHQSLQGATFHVEHITPISKGGGSQIANLALACPSCNLHKADRTTAIDPVSGACVPLFHPSEQTWSDHFRCSGHQVEGLTPIGRATAALLHLNQWRRQRIRAAEERFGLYPPSRAAVP